MMLSLDIVTLGVPEVQTAHAFYTSVFHPTDVYHGPHVNLDMHGTGQIALYDSETLAAEADVNPKTSGFRGYILSYIVDQPSEVKALLDVAVQSGAKVLKPAKKILFGGFSAVFQAPDGAIWKLAASNKKDTGPAEKPPRPTEATVAILGVAEPKASKAFYTALGMMVDRDYGNQYIDFRPAPGTCRLGLMTRRALAKDAGINEDGAGFQATVFTRRAASRDEVDALLAAAASAGGQITVAAGESEGGYSGHFTDPDGFLWKVVSA